MRSQAAAFDDAREALRRLGVPDVLPMLHAAGISISRSVLGGSHSVAVYPPLDSLIPVDPAHIVSTVSCGRETSLYVHIAFCETRCTFCHYAVDHVDAGKNASGHGSKVARYLDALKRELVFWGAALAASKTAVSSIYIGGGTPLVLDGESLCEIIEAIRNEFEVLPGAEICLEGSPLTITAPGGQDKLRLLKEKGVTRLSFGVQSFDDAVLKYAARGYRRDLPVRASAIVAEIFENWNLDLIQGLYQGSPCESWENLKAIAEIRPPHLTWYHARFADRPQGSWYQNESKRTGFEDEAATLLGRLLIWQEMAGLGYLQIDGNRFVRESRYRDPYKKIRTSASHDLLGVGASSYSHVNSDAADNCRGYLFRNETSIRSYVERVLSGDIPIATGRIIDENEFFAASYATGLRDGRIESSDLRSIREKKPDLSSYYNGLVETLSDIGILTADDAFQAGLRLSQLGRLFEDETLALFYSPEVKKTLALKQGCA